jgi:hypothetical protein
MNDLVEYLRQIDTSSPLLHWVLGSVLAYVALAHVLWLVRSRSLWRPLYSGLLEQTGRLLFFLGVPYLALGGWPRPPLSGLLSLADLGFVGWGPSWPATRWLQAAGNGLGLGLAASAILLLAWVIANRGMTRESAYRGLWFPSRPWWWLLVDVLYLEVHWAFYRGALTLLLDDAYVGVFVGAALIYLEWGLDPLWRQGWRQGSQAASRWLCSAQALIAAVIFLTTGNLWVCLLVHGLIQLTFWHLGREHPAHEEVGHRPDARDAMDTA